MHLNYSEAELGLHGGQAVGCCDASSKTAEVISLAGKRLANLLLVSQHIV